MKKINLDANRITDKEAMSEYMHEIFELPDYFGGNLDALYDCLSEITEDFRIVITRKNLGMIAESEYAFRTLKVLWQAADENPHICLQLRN